MNFLGIFQDLMNTFTLEVQKADLDELDQETYRCFMSDLLFAQNTFQLPQPRCIHCVLQYAHYHLKPLCVECAFKPLLGAISATTQLLREDVPEEAVFSRLLIDSLELHILQAYEEWGWTEFWWCVENGVSI